MEKERTVGGYKYHKCPKCGNEDVIAKPVKVINLYCDFCGKIIDGRYDNYCGNCGKKQRRVSKLEWKCDKCTFSCIKKSGCSLGEVKEEKCLRECFSLYEEEK